MHNIYTYSKPAVQIGSVLSSVAECAQSVCSCPSRTRRVWAT